MTREELKEIKAAAVKVHADAVAAGRWKGIEERKDRWEEIDWDNIDWETRLMRTVRDIACASGGDRERRRADLSEFEAGLENYYKTRHKKATEDEKFIIVFNRTVIFSVEDILAQVIIQMLDLIEGFNPGWRADMWSYSTVLEMLHAPVDKSFIAVCYHLSTLITPYAADLVCAFEVLRRWSETQGVDMRRFVQLRMRYNELRRGYGQD